MAKDTQVVFFRGLTDDGARWIVTFEYEVSGHIWMKVNVPVGKEVDDEQIIPFAKHCFAGLCETAASKTADWRMSDEALREWGLN